MATFHCLRIVFARRFSTFNFINVAKSSDVICESHKIVTEDGYILTLHRMQSKEYSDKINKIPILLQHGLWSSSEDWILPGPSKSIGHILAEEGYDVWFGNTRGNHYSREHVKYSPFQNPKEYWNFSWHEMGYFDLPAMIEFVLQHTAQPQLYYIGHSQGTTSFFVMGSTRLEICNKVKAMFALAPVVYLRHMRNDDLLKLSTYQQSLFVFLSCIGFYKLVFQENMLLALDKIWSKNFDKHSDNILKNLSFHATPDVKENLRTILMSHVSCGTSFKLLAHFAQCTIQGKKFRQFDYGPVKNLRSYGTEEAPAYNLKNISVPIVLFHSDSDWLTHPMDVKALIEDLPKNTFVEKVQPSKYNHLDFLWADFKSFNMYKTLKHYLQYFENCENSY